MSFFAVHKQKIHIFIFLVVLCTMTSVIYHHIDELKQLPSLSSGLYLFSFFSLLMIILSNGLIYDKLTPTSKLSFKESWHLAMGTSFGNLFGPPKSGLALRAFILKKKGLAYPSFMALTLVVLILATAIQLVLASFALGLLKDSSPHLIKLFYLCSCASLFCCFILYLHKQITKIKTKKIPFSQEILKAYSQIIDQKSSLLKASLLTLLNTLIGALFFHQLLSYFNSPLAFSHCLIIYALSGLLTALSVTPGAIGFFEAPPLFFSHVFQIPQSSIIACLIIYRIFELGLSLIFGGFSSWTYYRQGFNIMKKISSDLKT